MVGSLWKKVAGVGLFGVVLSGCDALDERADLAAQADEADEEDDVEARAGGSCEGFCGEMAPSGCWCDDQCAQYGDCCADRAQVCDGPPPEDPTDDPPGGSDVPDNAYCAAVTTWPAGSKSFEEDVVVLVNQQRAAGASCGGTAYGPAGPLAMHGALRCAARKHDVDMISNNFFSHTGTGGTLPWDRMTSAGYGAYTNAGENIAAGQTTPAAVVTGWMNSPGHCTNIMNPAFEQIGVGYAPGGSYGHYWTQTFGAQ